VKVTGVSPQGRGGKKIVAIPAKRLERNSGVRSARLGVGEGGGGGREGGPTSTTIISYLGAHKQVINTDPEHNRTKGKGNKSNMHKGELQNEKGEKKFVIKEGVFGIAQKKNHLVSIPALKSGKRRGEKKKSSQK